MPPWRRQTARVLPVDAKVAQNWGRLNARSSFPVVDSLLAATAEAHGLILVTRNLKDIERSGVRCINPFEPADRLESYQRVAGIANTIEIKATLHVSA